MFIGEYLSSFDDKNRITVPAKFRKQLKSTVVVTRGLDQSLFLYTLDEWKILAAKLSSLPLSTPEARAFSRLMLAGAMDVTIDKQGRLMLPTYLKDFARMDKKVVIAGLYNRLELWSETLWNQYKASTESQTEALASQLASLGV